MKSKTDKQYPIDQEKITSSFLKQIHTSKSIEDISRKTIAFILNITNSNAAIAGVFKNTMFEVTEVCEDGKWTRLKKKSNINKRMSNIIKSDVDFSSSKLSANSFNNVSAEFEHFKKYRFIARIFIRNQNDKIIGAVKIFRDSIPYTQKELGHLKAPIRYAGKILSDHINRELSRNYFNRIKTINKIVHKINISQNTEQIVRKISPLIKKETDFDTLILALFDDEEDVVTDLFHIIDKRELFLRNIHSPISSEKIRHILKTKKSFIIDDITKQPNLTARESAVRSGMISELMVGCTLKGNVVGSLTITKRESSFYTDEDRNFLEMLSQQLGNAMIRLRYREILKKKAKYSEATNIITRETLKIKNIPSIIRYLFKETSKCVAFEAGMIGLFSDNYKKVQLYIYSNGNIKKMIEQDIEPERTDSIVSHLKDRKMFLRADNEKEVKFLEDKIALETGLKSGVVLPLSMPDKVTGFLAVASSRVKAFDNTDLSGLGMIAGNFAMALQNASLIKEALQEKVTWEKTFDSIKDFILLTDRKGNVIRLNNAAMEVMIKSGIKKDKLNIRCLFNKLKIDFDESYKKVVFDECKTATVTVESKTKNKSYTVSISPCCAKRSSIVDTAIYLIKDVSHLKQAGNETKKLYKIASKKAFELKTLNVIAKIANSKPPSNRTFMEIGREIEKIIPFDCSGRIWVYDKKGNPIGIYSMKNINRRFPKDHVLARGIKNTAIEETIKTGKPFIRNDIGKINKYSEDNYIGKLKIKSIILIPLKSREQITGCISLGRKSRNQFTGDDILFLEQVAVHISSMLENNRLLINEIKANEEWEKTFDSISDYIFITDNNFNIIKYNTAFKHDYIKMKAISETPKCHDIFPCIKKQNRRCVQEEIMSLLKPSVTEIEDISTGKIFLKSVYSLSIPGSETEGYIHIATDITEMKKAEKQLREQNIQINTIFDNFPDTLILLDSERRVIKSNKVADELVGFNLTRNPPLTLTDMLSFFPKDIVMTDFEGNKIFFDNQPLFKAFAAGESTINQQVIMYFPDGRKISGLLNVIVLKDSYGNIINVMTTLKDITEQRARDEKTIKQAEELNNIFSSFQDGLLIIDLKNGMFRANDAAKSLFNIENEDDKFDRSVFFEKNRYFDVNGNELPPNERPIAKTIREIKHVVNRELMLIVDNSKRIPMIVNTAPLLDNDGNLYGVLGVFRDITKQKEFEKRLINTEKLSSLGTMVSGIAHELNNPLAGIVGFSELLLGERLNDSIMKKIKIIHAQAERSSKIVEGLLSFSRQKTTDKKLIGINKAIGDALELVTYGFKDKKIILGTKLSPDLLPVLADKNQIIQVFINIINNSIHSFRQNHDKKLISITSSSVKYTNHVTEDEINGIKIQFEDNGTGIDSDKLHHIFDPFFTTKSTGEGIGLGLSISYGIIKEHGGEITAESIPGTGTIITVFLPTADIDISKLVPIEALQTAAKTKNINHQNILLIGGSLSTENILLETLSNNGYSVFTSINSHDALEKISSIDFELIINELKSEGTEAIDFYKKATKAKSYLADRFLFITENTLNRETNRFLKMTGNKYITRPLSASAVEKAVDSFLNNEKTIN